MKNENQYWYTHIFARRCETPRGRRACGSAVQANMQHKVGRSTTSRRVTVMPHRSVENNWGCAAHCNNTPKHTATDAAAVERPDADSTALYLTAAAAQQCEEQS
jgi:hypothetical protein